jgi:FlaA1/EpsC-like NDP-sugar epimerase
MGASKRISELILQGFAADADSSGIRFTMVRFGNVIGSPGSVITLFRRQIAEGGPVTVTDPEMTRYFMSIREAA